MYIYMLFFIMCQKPWQPKEPPSMIAVMSQRKPFCASSIKALHDSLEMNYTKAKLMRFFIFF